MLKRTLLMTSFLGASCTTPSSKIVNLPAGQQSAALPSPEPFVPEPPKERDQRFCTDSIYGQYLKKHYRAAASKELRSIRGWRQRRQFKRKIKHEVRHHAKIALDHSEGVVTSESFPVVRNPKVDRWIHYFENEGRSTFMKWLVRSENFKGILLPLLKEDGMPQELLFLAMIESGFNNRAYSRARATGTWQFMSGTARIYGLRVNYWLDERRDPVKSTVAAAKYLKDLYTDFGDWYLAIASYNAGPGRINRAIRRLKTRDFWTIAESRYIRSETKNYVPKMLAALNIARNPQKYGFYYIPSANDYTPRASVTVDRPVKLSDVAQKLNIPAKYLQRWNPELIKGITPPLHRIDGQPYRIRIPENYVQQFEAIKPTLAFLEIKDVKMHRIRRGETLTHIARRYKVPLRKIMKMNPNLSPRRLRPGKKIAIPIPAIITRSKPKTV
ncbi:lytic transglycosylase domain-containing protein [Pseudobacteriovorax antillogorgiicola]|uniref:Membrane-bound lytic murein transglycosylase D n=1 Tax=Pseudobacteriovorax antillogorgiicola TaxID=1513793 RepID=A0A1Y6B596_9BACT|nr:lytic transglycosylase domain-containing protein [Pseudobacteriovorax antillogorgiicola]TCS59419.1 membrane-bound lytic murein transglycosylase D [Pseudobacteriovorax antillogorgiicola]SME88445.1 membrane-bound lytic murein transglycosylase D [Pseudobacteriovorax antillogorgiicola]